MRKIKFRALTLEDELIYFDLHESKISGDSEVFYVKDVPCKSGTEQQFAGAHDMNGKEIYEGDLIIWSMVSNRIREVAHFGSSFKIHGGSIYNIDDCDPEKEFEVVGNIHKNPELIQ